MPIPRAPEPAIAATPSRRAPPRAQSALAALSAATNRCRECPIGAGATQSVIGEGRPGARLMLVGEQPGDQEDVQGRPFVGPAGRLLDRALGALSWSREAVFVTNAVKHFKYELRGKRRIHKTPAQREVEACLHWLEDEIALVRPEAIVAMGATAARALLGRPIGVTGERGHWLEREADARQVLITLHPSALLRVLPAQRDETFALWLRDLALASAFARGADGLAPEGPVRSAPRAPAPAARHAPTARASARGSRRGDR